MIPPTEIIKLSQVNYQVHSGNEQLTILNDMNLVIHAGMSVAITGASGSGKTSLLNIMAGLIRPTSGQVFYRDKEITHLDEDQRASLRAKYIGFIFQTFQLLPNLTAIENVMLPLEINKIANAREKAIEWMNHVGLAHRTQHYPWQLSGGEQQRTAIARAFAITPTVLFADEPTGNLDKKTGHRIIELLFHLNTVFHSTLVIVTHDDELAASCQHHWPLLEGRIQC